MYGQGAGDSSVQAVKGLPEHTCQLGQLETSRLRTIHRPTRTRTMSRRGGQLVAAVLSGKLGGLDGRPLLGQLERKAEDGVATHYG